VPRKKFDTQEPELDFHEDLKINKFRLDQECELQPGLYMRYAEAAAQAKKEFDDAWEDVKVVRAELIKEAGENGAKNDAQREAYYRTHTRHKAAKSRKLKAEYNYNILNYCVFALQQRKSAIEMLVKLWAGEYYSEPRPEGEPKRRLEETIVKSGKRKVKTKRRST
jgi:hypothetical protein